MAALQPVPQARRTPPELTQARLKELLHYDPGTGVFTWRFSRRRVKRRDVAGSDNGSGYISIAIDGGRYRAHRLAWLYMTGKWPNGDVDHVNRCRSDNRWENLREATRSQNCANRPLAAENTSGARGVSWSKRDEKWRAEIRVNGKIRYLGVYSDIGDAAAAYSSAAEKAFGEFVYQDAENA